MRAALSGPLMCCPWAPSSPVGEVEQQGAMERWRLEERNADQRETHLQVLSVMLWSGIKLLISLMHPLTHLVHQSPTFSSSQSPACSFTQSVTHLLTYTSFTYSLCNNTNKQINKAISDGNSPSKTKTTSGSFHHLLMWSSLPKFYEHHPSASRVSALQSSRLGDVAAMRWRAHTHFLLFRHLDRVNGYVDNPREAVSEDWWIEIKRKLKSKFCQWEGKGNERKSRWDFAT